MDQLTNCIDQMSAGMIVGPVQTRFSASFEETEGFIAVFTKARQVRGLCELLFLIAKTYYTPSNPQAGGPPFLGRTIA
jgi:hypothetical protein